MSRGDLGRDERRLWLLIGLIGAVTLAGLAVAGFGVRGRSLLAPVGGAATLHLVSLFYRIRRPDPRLAATCAALAQLVLFTLVAGPLSYLVATAAWPLQDTRLAAADAWLGFDWRSLLDAVNARPTLGRTLKLAYDTLMPQLAAALLVLGLSGRLRALRVFVWAVVLGGSATVLLSGLVPAVGYFTHLGLGPADYPNLDPSAAFVHMADVSALRAGGGMTIDLAALQGIITFPSFHATLAALYLWAFWQHPLARWPGLIFEAAVIAATPIHGGHYLVDVIAGIVVAAVAIAAGRRLAAAPGGMPVAATLAA